jgi:hypothetical protein
LSYRTLAIVAAGLLLGAGSRYWTRRPPPPPPARPGIVVPQAAGEITIDGEFEDPGWQNAVHTGAFRTVSGAEARPYSDARFVQRDGQLFIILYAADEDIRTDGSDAFQLRFVTAEGERPLEISPKGDVKSAGWDSHARVSIDRDGTFDDPSDQDEEWVVEMALPLAALGLRGAPGERLQLTIRRGSAGWGLREPVSLAL